MFKVPDHRHRTAANACQQGLFKPDKDAFASPKIVTVGMVSIMYSTVLYLQLFLSLDTLVLERLALRQSAMPAKSHQWRLSAYVKTRLLNDRGQSQRKGANSGNNTQGQAGLNSGYGSAAGRHRRRASHSPGPGAEIVAMLDLALQAARGG